MQSDLTPVYSMLEASQIYNSSTTRDNVYSFEEEKVINNY